MFNYNDRTKEILSTELWQQFLKAWQHTLKKFSL